MFTIYHSNQTDLLKSLISELMKRDPLDNVFTPEMIIVQSQGMEQWLQIELAQELGIAANIEFPFPTPFIRKLYQRLLPNLPLENSFTIESMTWQLYELLPKITDEPKLTALKHYLSIKQSDRKFYQLASRIAYLFDQYLVYRPDWIAKWEMGQSVAELNQHPAEIWQSELWRRLVLANPPFHRANIYWQVLEVLKNQILPKEALQYLPKRIFIFGINSLPPVYLNLLDALSQHIDVHLMFNNPCKWYWGDIINKQLITPTISLDNKPNALLTSFGKLGRDNLFLLQELTNKKDIEAFVDYENDHLLPQIQQAILDLYPTKLVKQIIDKNDNSISFHACHNEQREVEVLYDYLLSAFEQDPELELRDCIVMVSDIDRYVPYIRAIFGNAKDKRYLPFTISDQKARNIDPIVQGFFAILQFPQSRLTAEELFNLLEIPAIAEKFSITESQLVILRTWIIESGIRFGLDDKHSWLFGLERLLLGYMMAGDLGDWQQILPYNGATGLDAELIGQLAEFVQQVRKWINYLSESKSLNDWQGSCLALINDFFVINPKREAILLLIEEEWQKMINGGLQAHFIERVPIEVLYDAMQSRLEENYLAHRFLIGKINFCTMMPMRSIPFKVVCLLGMNESDYPRISIPLDFDLITYQGRRGDRNRRNDDRYLFLEAILSAQKQLYISYIGRDIKDNTERYPSILVDELWEYIIQNYAVLADKPLNTNSAKSPTQDSPNPITEQPDFLRVLHTRTPFNPQNFYQQPRSYVDEWLPAALKIGNQQSFLTAISPIQIDSLNIDELKRFYQHSVRFFLQKRFNYYLQNKDSSLPESENFTLNGLERYQLNQKLLNHLLDEDERLTTDAFYQQSILTGLLPDGAFGEIIFEEQKSIMQSLADKIKREKSTMITQEVNLTLNLPISEQICQLNGWLTHIQEDGILQWKVVKLSIREGIAFWIDHLLYCILNPYNEMQQSRLYGRDNSEWRFLMLDKQQALAYLVTLMDGYVQGLNNPLLLPIQSAWQWLKTAYDESTSTFDNQQKADKNLAQSWRENTLAFSEFDDYYAKLYPELTDTLIAQISTHTKNYLLPIFQYLIQ